jgi:hypothetical protein
MRRLLLVLAVLLAIAVVLWRHRHRWHVRATAATLSLVALYASVTAPHP